MDDARAESGANSISRFAAMDGGFTAAAQPFELDKQEDSQDPKKKWRCGKDESWLKTAPPKYRQKDQGAE